MQAASTLVNNVPIASSSSYTAGVELLQLSLPPEPQYVAFARRSVREVTRQLSMDADSTDDVLLAVGEACNNAVLYGASRPQDQLNIVCRLIKKTKQGHDALEIDIRNHGAGVPKDSVGQSNNMPPPDELNEHGRGLPLMYQLMDSVQFLSENGDTVVRLTKLLQ